MDNKTNNAFDFDFEDEFYRDLEDFYRKPGIERGVDPGRLGWRRPWYMKSRAEGPTTGFHYHHCRECFIDYECLNDECWWRPEFICHNCYEES
jgi:hypothetical protein